MILEETQMEILVVTLAVCMILSLSYVFFSKDAKRKKAVEYEKNLLLRDFYKQEIKHMEILQLEGIGNDENSDFEFKQAVKRINLPNDIRVQIYD